MKLQNRLLKKISRREISNADVFLLKSVDFGSGETAGCFSKC